MKSNFFTLNKQDLIKGLIVAFVTALLTSLLQVLESGGLPSSADIKTMLITSITAALAYLLKNFVTNSNDEIIKPEPKKEN